MPIAVFDRVAHLQYAGREQAQHQHHGEPDVQPPEAAPDMALHHHVPAGRLTRNYFRRWWYWKGISRSRLHRIHPKSDGGSDLSKAKRIAGVPLYTVKAMARHIMAGLGRLARRDIIGATRHEMMLAYYAGFAREDWRLARGAGLTPRSDPPAHAGMTRA